ncbi:MAG: methylmalonyl-CoA mutase [Bacteroidota bacterium]|jgi:methylmalonyl-CoA mutase|nr:methylmalonyl-CoA mutase [Bacteroidota bacterium]
MQKLFSEFNPVTANQWKEQLIKDLKGIDYKNLIWETNSGFKIQPFYTKADLKGNPSPLFHLNDWSICEMILVNEEKAANQQALDALEHGASGLIFQISKKTDFSLLLSGISLKHIYTLFKIESHVQEDLLNYFMSHNCGTNCFIECDEVLRGIITAPNHTICANASLYQESGSNTVHELAFTLAHVNEYLTLNSTVSIIHLTVSVGGDFFMEIGKLRALRRLLQFLMDQYSINAKIHIHAQTTSLNKSAADSYNNLLRSTTEAMSAAIGGANSVCVLPFDQPFKAPGDFSLRMARNQQLILKEESYLNAVADISAGSYYIESLTETLCQLAWEEFKDLEAKGGLFECLKLNTIQKIISEDAQRLIQQFKDGKLVLVGVNKFQNKNESPEELKVIKPSNVFGIKPVNLSESSVQQSVN